MSKKMSFAGGVLIIAIAASLLITCKKSSDNSSTSNNNTTAAPTCSDGIQNQNETGIDCGGPCSVATCKDGVTNAGEAGMDCGGTSCNPCPNNTTAGNIMAIVDGCSWSTATNDFRYNGTNSMTLKCSSTSPAISIQIDYNGPVTTNTNYAMSSSQVTIGSTVYNVSSNGFIKFSVIDNMNHKMTGLFSFSAWNGSAKKCVSSGSFNNVPFHP